MIKKYLGIVLLLIIFFIFTGFGNKYEKPLKEAKKMYAAGQEEKAKPLFKQAAELGSAEAHYLLQYNYIVNDEEEIYHLTEATKLGHGEAFGSLMEALLFRADSLITADPQKALEIYEATIKKYPKISYFDMESEYEIIKKCAEAGPFDGKAFMNKYNLKEEKALYNVWMIAEEYSKGGKYGKPDPKVLFQLIARGGCVPMEFAYAVRDFYDNWKNGVIKEFDICNYAASGDGLSLCAGRIEKNSTKKNLDKLSATIETVGKDKKTLIKDAYKAAEVYFDKKVWKEEGHGGSGYVMWATDALLEHKSNYLKLITNIKEGFIPENVEPLAENDKELNRLYLELKDKLQVKAINGDKFTIDSETLKEVQKSWIQYRDKSAALFAKISTNNDMDFWKSWLTKQRIESMQELMEMWEFSKKIDK